MPGERRDCTADPAFGSRSIADGSGVGGGWQADQETGNGLELGWNSSTGWAGKERGGDKPVALPVPVLAAPEAVTALLLALMDGRRNQLPASSPSSSTGRASDGRAAAIIASSVPLRRLAGIAEPMSM